MVDAMNDELVGLTIGADASLRRHDDGRVLMGGSPLRVVRLSERGAAELDRLVDGDPVPASPGVLRLVRRLLDLGMVQPLPHSSPFALTDVTVVIPVRGVLDPGLLDGIGRVARIVVVDDASDPAVSTPATTTHGVTVEVLRRDHRGGPGAARNTGLGVVDTSVVAFVDADCAPRPGWLEPLLLQFADPQVALVAPRIVAAEPEGDTGRRRLARYEREEAALDLGPERGRVRARSRIAYVPSAAVCARTEVIRDMRGFDESMPVGEDVDLVWRLDEAGWTVRYEPTVRVAHRHRTTPWSWLRRRFDYGTSAGPLARRHPGAMVPVEASGWSYATWGLLAAGHPAAAAVTVGATAGVLERHLRGVDRPMLTAANLTMRGHLGAGRLLARAIVRPWWPVALLASVLVPSRRLRLVVAGAVIAPAAIKWYRHRPDLDPLTFLGLHLADDVAYSTGVWVGCARARTFEPITPELTAWPNPSRYSRWRAARPSEN
jgi:mycofactocin system glycosyltransferase